MVQFKTTILKFGSQGEKTGWTYIVIPATIAAKLKPGNKRSFRVKGFLDSYAFSMLALIPMGEGDFIMALNAEIRKQIGKRKGASLLVKMEIDKRTLKPNAALMLCLRDEPAALQFFEKLPQSHKNYFSKWIDSAKTEGTKTKRIAQAVNAFSKGHGYSEMIRSLKKDNELLRG